MLSAQPKGSVQTAKAGLQQCKDAAVVLCTLPTSNVRSDGSHPQRSGQHAPSGAGSSILTNGLGD